MFASKCVPAGRLFTRRMLRLLKPSDARGSSRGTHSRNGGSATPLVCHPAVEHRENEVQLLQPPGPTLGTSTRSTNLGEPSTSGLENFDVGNVFSTKTTRSHMPRPETSGPTGNPLLSVATQLSRHPGPSVADPCCVASKTPTPEAVRARGTQKSFLLDDNYRLDLRWWDTFLKLWNGTTSFLDVD